MPDEIELEKSASNPTLLLPESFESLTRKSSHIDTALHLQLLGITTSKHRQQERNRYFERSLASLRHVSKEVPEYRVLKARALFYLYRRPEAVKLLSTPISAEEKVFLSFLNGNFYELERQYKQLEPNIFQVFSYIELKQLANSYSITNDDYIMANHGTAWKFLLDQASHDNNEWKNYGNYRFFASLSGLYAPFDDAFKKDISAKITIDQLKDEYCLLYTSPSPRDRG